MQYKIAVLGIAAVAITAITSVLTVSYNNKQAKERELDLHRYREKQKVFEHFYNAYFEMLNRIRDGKNGLSRKAIDHMMDFKKGLMNWGSEEIIRKYLEYENKQSQGDDSFDLLRDGDIFFKELRKELGFKDPEDLNVMSVILTPDAREGMNKKKKFGKLNT